MKQNLYDSTNIKIKASYICENLFKEILLNNNLKGYAHSVFRNACNIEIAHSLITLLIKAPICPMSVIVRDDTGLNFIGMGIKRGMFVKITSREIELPEPKVVIDLEGAKSLYTGIEKRQVGLTNKDLSNNLTFLLEGINSMGKLNGAGLLFASVSEELFGLQFINKEIDYPDKNYLFIRQGFLQFLKAFMEYDLALLPQMAESIIGFGPGLTPAADDFICGLMIAFGCMQFGNERINEASRKIAQRCFLRTTRVSAEMLKNAAEGRVNQPVKELILALLSQKNKKPIISALSEVIKCGETSGTDIALGIYTGCRVALVWRQKENN